ncbi:merozoite surface protein, putative [Trichomonas vaginalis G3]|uniref:Merozoite surface protein, putative n=1 Tax=Trichomonas vaginalis (strain ATCC PRA-98 / G3) TaxID=412133 RepID=A2ER27_TRIV3|nr:hypothetical protein TVAGG3_0535110 [Trichomonas vaginalis G3]EAY04917.1 merozoite surface protein, putative [Trichomonas vaginalis G3]KAI5519425.1 hypothetical protein TVAGG3_0535110 [Trichomonas vaginalis G3]|eukprot:XP_001317140.1 merozoite surface protein [Trichomonas vaginalis G3]
MNRQKELRNLYRDFRSAIDSIQQATATKEIEVDNEEEEEEENMGEQEVVENQQNVPGEEEDHFENNEVEEEEESNDQLPSDLDLIVQEIDMLQNETNEILNLLKKSQIEKHPKVKSIRSQLMYVIQINNGLRERALRLAGRN